MDALTNVVAVLVIILMLLQLDVGSKMDKMLSELPQVNAEQLAEQQRSAKAAASAIADPKNKDILAPAAVKLSGAEKALAELEATSSAAGVKLLQTDALNTKIAEVQPRVDAEKKLLDNLLAESQRLDALLNATPAPKVVAPTVVRIPDIRNIPTDAVEFNILCLKDRVHLLDVDGARGLIAGELLRERNNLQRGRVKQAGRDRFIYDQDKTVRHFEKAGINAGGAAVRVPYNKPWRGLDYELVPIPQGVSP